MFLEISKLLGLFLLVFIIMRILGKPLLSQWTPYDLVTLIFLAYPALGAVNIDRFIEAIFSILIIGAVYILMSKLSLNPVLNRYIIGEPSILIKHGKIVQQNLQHVRYSLSELLSTIRSYGYPNVEHIEYAILEPNGEVSIIPKSEVQPLTPEHIDMKPEYEGLPIPVIVEGRIQHSNLKLVNKSEEWLRKELRRQGNISINRIFYAHVVDKKEQLTFFNYQ